MEYKGGDDKVVEVKSSSDEETITITSPVKFTNDVNGPLSIIGDLLLCPGTLFVSHLSSCDGVDSIIVDSPVTFTQLINIPQVNYNSITPSSGTLTVNGELKLNFLSANDYNFTNVNQGEGLSILGSSVGPGGNERSFKTLSSSDQSVKIVDSSDNLDLSVVTSPPTPFPIRVDSSAYITKNDSLYYLQPSFGFSNTGTFKSATTTLFPGVWKVLKLSTVKSSQYYELSPNEDIIGFPDIPPSEYDIPDTNLSDQHMHLVQWAYNNDLQFNESDTSVVFLIGAYNPNYGPYYTSSQNHIETVKPSDYYPALSGLAGYRNGNFSKTGSFLISDAEFGICVTMIYSGGTTSSVDYGNSSGSFTISVTPLGR